jgi:RNA polymerase sigma factor (sigma-70 family)
MVSTAPMDLVQAAKAGDTWAFEILLEPLIDPAYRLASGMLRDRAAAEDAVQEASILAWRNIRDLRNHDGMRAWFLAIVANLCRRARRQRWWSVLKFADLGSSDQRPVWRQPDTDLRRAIRSLNHRKRLVVVLYYYLDLPFAEIASIVGSTEAAAKATLYRAIRELKPALEAKET